LPDSVRVIDIQFQDSQTDRAEPSRILVILTLLRTMVIYRAKAERVLLNQMRARVRMTDRTHPFATITAVEAIHHAYP
jgi:hypothetical protein